MSIFTLSSKFMYKRITNNDLPKVTSIVKKKGKNVWEIYLMQKSLGNSHLSLWD